MIVGTNSHVTMKTRPKVERLEERALLSTTTSLIGTISARAATTPLKEVDYLSPTGGHVKITLFGSGTLAGTTYPGGVLNLEFSGTTAQSGIIGTVSGGDGSAPVSLIKHAGLPVTSLSGIGSSLLNVVNLKDFNLIDGGQVNLTGGVHILFLNSIGSSTQVHLRELPAALLNGTSATSSSENGVTVGFALDVAQGQTLTNVGGSFLPGTNLFPTAVTSVNSIVKAPGAPPAPSGVVVSINHINGPARAQQGLGTPEIFGYDATSNTLVKYNVNTDLTTNAITGVPVMTIPNAIPTGANPRAGAAIGRDNTKLVVMVDSGTNVYVYDAVSGAPMGGFSLANLNALFPTPINAPIRIGTFDSFTVVGNTNGGVNGLGRLIAIDVTKSLANGSAVILKDTSGNDTLPYDSTRALGYSGGFAGIPGTSTLYSAGGAFFDPYQPNSTQRGVASLSSGSTAGVASFSEASRNALTATRGTTVNSGPNGQVGTDPSNAFANIDLNLALITAADPIGQTNTITLYNPSTFAKVTTATLTGTPNLLTAITGTFRPALAGVALVDINGNTQSFRAQDAQGLVFNGLGNTNLVKIQRAVDSTIIGYPFAHAQIPLRNNVQIISTTRSPGSRNGVTMIPNLRPTGPLSEP